MKKYIVLLLLLLLLTGCGKKKEIVSTCINTTEGDGIIVKVTDVSKYDDNYMLTYSKIVTVESGFANYESYNNRKLEYEQLKNSFENQANYIINPDDNNRVIEVILIIDNYNLETYTESGRENLRAKNVIRNYEFDGYKCTLDGVTREELGL